MADAAIETRRSRFWLYAPFVLMALVAIAWSVAWFVIRDRATEALDRWLAAETRAGRQWTCFDRQIGGYPFRIEVSCTALALQQAGSSAVLGRVLSIAQVYRPGHVITHIAGPLHMVHGRMKIEGTWRLLETSLRGSTRGFERASLAAEGAQLRITGIAPDPIALASERFEVHLRPNPIRTTEWAAERAFDAALSASQVKIPLLDALLGGDEPANFQIDVTATEMAGLGGRPLADEFERWRQSNGTLDIVQASLAKGSRRMKAKGALRLDELHRPAGELAVSMAGLDGLINNLTGNRPSGNLLGLLLGQASPPRPGTQPGLISLPPLRLEEGRVLLGAFPMPNVRLAPLY